MQVKIDTKERFHVITLIEPHITANLAADLINTLTKYINQEIKNVILKLPETNNIEQEAAEAISKAQQKFYENNASFVICDLKPELETRLDELKLLEIMNVTPTESEAWDIVQMEEIERELMDSADVSFPAKDDD